MTIVLVHGVPETAAIWRPLIDALALAGRHEVVCLSPPGFGAPLPADFAATVDGYRTWLISELESFEAPVHLVGHDWGGGHVVGVALTRPDLIASWVTDIIGVYEPDYVWHEAAQIWQREDEGEQHLAALFDGTVDERAAKMTAFGIIGSTAVEVASAQGPEMATAILSLYRSAAQPVLADIGTRLADAARRPGLAIVATEDHAVGSLEQRLRAASRAAAEVATLDGLGHWWMLQNPDRGAEVLERFWGRVEIAARATTQSATGRR